MSPARYSVRPPTNSPEVGGGSDAKVDKGGQEESCREMECSPCDVRPMFPVGATGADKIDEHYELAQPEPRMDGGMDIDMIDEKPETDLKELLAVMHRDEKDAICEANAEILAIVKSLGGNQAGYRRERRKAIKAVVSEIDSPPRVTAATKLLPELRVMPGFALDLTTCDVDGRRWDFDEKVMRERALKRVREEKPLLLIGSPMCTVFSTWQRINNKLRDKYVVEAEKKRAVMHLEFCIELYREQLRHGRHFLHEHPAHASSWQEEAMRGLMSEQGVETATCDQCLYGCRAADGSPVKKPTMFPTNALELAKRLRSRCTGKN